MRSDEEKAEIRAANEREQIEWVFGLTGGELADERWDYAVEGRYQTDGEGTGDWYTFGRAYWYEGVPDYVESEFRNSDEHSGVYRTVLTFGGGYLDAPDPEIWDGSGRWVLRASYNNSGEADCPNRTWDPINRTDVQPGPRRVDVEEAVKGVREYVCPLCEAAVLEEHGYIYIGEGYEAVYELEEWPLPVWQVVVGNIGSVFMGTDKEQAFRTFREYIEQSKSDCGRAAGESVVLMRDDEIEEEFEDSLRRGEG